MRPMSLALCAGVLLASCAGMSEPEGPARKELVYAVNDAAELIKFNAGQPRRILERKPLQGLADGDKLLGIDFRVARGVLFALSASGKVYTIDTRSGSLTQVGTQALVLPPGRWEIDFNPVADRIRVVSDNGSNLRLHPETGAVAATDPALAYAAGDVAAGKSPQVAAAAYTYNKSNDKLTTNYAIDLKLGTLVSQGSKEGVNPAVSPNTGRLFTVGALGVGRIDSAAFDIADINNAAFAALRINGRTRLHWVDLDSGKAQLIGTVDDGRALWGMAIEP